MELFDAIIDHARQNQTALAWPALAAGLKRAAARQSQIWKLPVVGCQAFGGTAGEAIPAAAAMICSEIAILLVDDILDGDPRGEYQRIGAGPAANLAMGMEALALDLVLDDEDQERAQRAGRALTRMLVTVAHGQALDVKNRCDEAHYWQVTEAKSAAWFASALYLGALYANATPKAADQLYDFGLVYGQMMQIHDDLNDVLASPANVDWTSGRYPLPILFAETVNHPERDRLIALRRQVGEALRLEEAQAILASCGAISYSVNELLLRHQRARQLLKALQAPNSTPLNSLLQEVIEPVEHLFAAVGGEMQALASD
jgi:geranylgeranyl diphosphate synthase type I